MSVFSKSPAPLEKERLANDLGQGIRKTVTEIQPGHMTALAEVKERLPRQMRLLDGKKV